MANSSNIHVHNGYQKDAYTYYPVLIVGAGESGIAMGCRLKEKLGFDQFRIFDRQSGMGGTWWINRYPGVACDVPTVFYSFSFAPHYTAQQLYPKGSTIVEYLHRVAAQYQIQDKVQLNTDVTEVVYDETEELYHVTLTHMAPGKGDMGWKDRSKHIEQHGEDSVYLGQQKVKAKIVISCVGGLVEPKAWPENIPGNESFEGEIFHSARWREDINLDGKDVLVVGTGCSAAQVVPSILKPPYNVNSVTQLMRSPPWTVPKAEEPFGKERYAKYAPTIMHYTPLLGWMLRESVAFFGELDWFTIFQSNSWNEKNRKDLETKMNERMRRIAPEKYHKMLTPDYGIGCKRRIFDSEWYKGMRNPKFRLTTQHLTRVTPKGVIIGPGRAYPPESIQDDNAPTGEEEIKADVIVLANGFETVEYLHPLRVKGKGGKLMHDVWQERGGCQSYLGTAMDGFPNFFMIIGPNTITGHSSVILATENMVELILKIIGPVLKNDASTIEVKTYAEMKYTAKVQRQLKDTVFHGGGCSSWYFDKTGWNPNAYPRSQIDFWLRCKFPKWSDWQYGYTTKGLVKRRASQALKTSLLLAAIVGAYLARKSGQNLATVLNQYTKMGLFLSLNALKARISKLQKLLAQ